jgi:hypothetical protein
MTKTDGSKYDPPRGVRLSDAANGQGLPCHDGNSASGGQSCTNGATDVSCKVTGNSATAHCANGQGATGCLGAGNTPHVSTCNSGNTPLGGCVVGSGVHGLH